jgi:RNA polymerase sigma-70 factor, ECF subfamily
MPPALARALFETHPGPYPAEDALLRLEARLGEVMAEARAAWPDLRLEPASFVRYLGERLPADVEPEVALGKAHASDLYLACGCAIADDRALRALEARFLSRVPGWVAAYQSTPAFVDEVRAALRERLLVSHGDALPKITTYTGRAPLGAWLRIAAVRVAINLRRGKQPQPLPQEGGLELRDGASDPELHLMKTHYRSEIEAAFRATLASLDRRWRTILRLYFLDGLTTAQIGAVYRVHPTTVSRWVADARRSIIEETRRQLAQQARLGATSLTSVLQLVKSEIDVSIARYLGKGRRGAS